MGRRASRNDMVGGLTMTEHLGHREPTLEHCVGCGQDHLWLPEWTNVGEYFYVLPGSPTTAWYRVTCQATFPSSGPWRLVAVRRSTEE